MENRTFSVDRLEGEYAVLCYLEDGESKTRNVAKVELPRNVREGDVLRRSPQGDYKLDAIETANRRKKAVALLDELLY